MFGYFFEQCANVGSTISGANGNDAVLPVALYRYVGQVESAHEYMLGEAIFEALKTGHYGPWTDDDTTI